MSVEDFQTDVQENAKNLYASKEKRETAIDDNAEINDDIQTEIEYTKTKNALREVYAQTKDNPELQKAFVEELNALGNEYSSDDYDSELVKMDIMSWIDTKDGIQKQINTLGEDFDPEQVDKTTDNEKTRAIQEICVALGLDIGIGTYGEEGRENGVDGLYGKKTTEGVKKIQKWLYLEETGEFDTETLDKLRERLHEEREQTYMTTNAMTERLRELPADKAKEELEKARLLNKETQKNFTAEDLQKVPDLFKEQEKAINLADRKVTTTEKYENEKLEVTQKRVKMQNLALENAIQKISEYKAPPKWDDETPFIAWGENNIKVIRPWYAPNKFISRAELGIDKDSSFRTREIVDFLNQNKDKLQNRSELRANSNEEMNYETLFADILNGQKGYEVTKNYRYYGEAVSILQKGKEKYVLQTKGLSDQEEPSFVIYPWGSFSRSGQYVSGSKEAIANHLTKLDQKKEQLA